MLRLLLAWLHLLALGIGLGAVWVRARALSSAPDRNALRRAFVADTAWGIAAGLWITTGLWRLFAATEKSTAYYLQNHLFYTKMALLVLVLSLEAWPMVTLIRWRARLGRGEDADAVGAPAVARRIATVSYVEAGLVAAMVLTATAMARGLGARG